MNNSVNIIAIVGLALGGIFGLAGAAVTQPNLQAILWGIDGAGLVMATALLTVKYLRTGNDVVAGGFLIFAIAEGVLLSGPAAGALGSIPSFAAGTRLVGDSAAPRQHSKAVCHADQDSRHSERGPVYYHRGKNLRGEQLLPTSTPLPSYAYPLLVATFIGWIWTLWHERA